ncbi:protein kinase [Streptomyces sp. CAU 1734]|uniref:serine/threonine-protein kinase n=1 Tax=Streptomyces sp. CAU 1734 TaxID=3140360 RepID=UPI0032613195
MQPLNPEEPHTIGAYRLLGRLGSGGMGRVYLGRSTGGRTVAVKIVHPHFARDGEFRARFRREVEVARRVGGRWTAPVLDADPDATVPWVATGFVAGPPLSRAVAEHGPLPGPSLRVLAAGLAEALCAVHALELVHRDVKPSNVLLTLDGPRLIDFGIARATDGTASLTSTGVPVGSPGYMSPEQVLGKEVTGASDVFSLGAVLAYAAMGAGPFPGDSSAALLYRVVHGEPELPWPDGPGGPDAAIRELVAGCLAKDPADRPDPREIARTMAPDGAAEAAGSGWLPGPLVAEAGRVAVSLLDLEPEAVSGAEPEAAPDPASGPVEFTTPAVRGPAMGPSAGTGDPAGSTGDTESTEGTEPPLVTGPRPGAAPGSGESGRRRRVSCTFTLTLALALAGLSYGLNSLPDTWTGDNSGADKGKMASPPEHLPSGSATDGAWMKEPTATTPVRQVPKGFVGTWTGPVTLSSGDEGTTATAVIKPGPVGDRIGTVRQYDSAGGLLCSTGLLLTGATGSELRAVGTSSCVPGTHTVTFRLIDNHVRWTSGRPGADSPAGILRRPGPRP